MSERKLLFSVSVDDCKVYTFTVGGHGGAGKDTSNTGVRIVHPPSGAAGVGVTHRSQHRNKLDAFKRMRQSKEFKAWHLKMTRELLEGKTVEEKVEEAMKPHNLKIEVRTEKGWQDCKCGGANDHCDGSCS